MFLVRGCYQMFYTWKINSKSAKPFDIGNIVKLMFWEKII